MAFHWFIFRSKPRKERVIWAQIHALHLEAFYPCYWVNTRRGLKIQPYFPGYLFVRADLDSMGISRFQWMPFAAELVCLGEDPARVPDSLIQAIRLRAQKSILNGAEIVENISVDQSNRVESFFDLSLPVEVRVERLLQGLHAYQGVPLV